MTIGTTVVVAAVHTPTAELTTRSLGGAVSTCKASVCPSGQVIWLPALIRPALVCTLRVGVIELIQYPAGGCPAQAATVSGVVSSKATVATGGRTSRRTKRDRPFTPCSLPDRHVPASHRNVLVGGWGARTPQG